MAKATKARTAAREKRATAVERSAIGTSGRTRAGKILRVFRIVCMLVALWGSSKEVETDPVEKSMLGNTVVLKLGCSLV